jgi:hypothetical protein
MKAIIAIIFTILICGCTIVSKSPDYDWMEKQYIDYYKKLGYTNIIVNIKR